MAQPTVEIYPTPEALYAAAADRVAGLLAAAIAARGRALVALSGGSAPPAVFPQLIRPPLRERVGWPALSVVFADERYVPFSHDDSNYLLARQTLLDYVPVPSDQIFPVATYYRDPARAAAVYGQQLAALLQIHGGQIDLALLGMGPDGHTASLFPGHPALGAPAEQLAIAVAGAPKPPPTRISLTAGALNTARAALFIVSGADKAPAARAALRGPADPARTPAQLVRPAQGELIWLLDAAAAADL